MKQLQIGFGQFYGFTGISYTAEDVVFRKFINRTVLIEKALRGAVMVVV